MSFIPQTCWNLYILEIWMLVFLILTFFLVLACLLVNQILLRAQGQVLFTFI